MVKRVQSNMAENGVNALLISTSVNVQWVSGFTGSFGFALLTPTDAVFITDSRYTVQAAEQIKDLEVVSFGSPSTLNEILGDQFRKLGITELAFENGIPYSQWEGWKEKFTTITWKPAGDILTNLRKIKTAEEAAKIREACKLADACMDHASRMIQVGISEFDIGLDIEFFFRRNGAGIGFEPIVASGPNSAKPHARPSERKIESGDFVTLDIGCTLNGYSSDMTRTFVVGKATARHREIYDLVARAEAECCTMLAAGANGKDVDCRAREILDEKGLAQYFGHSLGHGLGREVHDPGRLHVSADEPINVGQCWTVEPGVYIQGFGGVRVEDDVLVTESGPEILTFFPKELIEIGT